MGERAAAHHCLWSFSELTSLDWDLLVVSPVAGDRMAVMGYLGVFAFPRSVDSGDLLFSRAGLVQNRLTWGV